MPEVTASPGLSADAPRDTPPVRTSRRMWTWETDVRDARMRAKKDQLPLVVYLRADWSAAALEMDRNVWSDPRILIGPHLVVPVRIDVTDGPDAELWAEEFRVQALPATIFFDAEGRETMRFEGARSAEEVLAALRQIEKETSDR